MPRKYNVYESMLDAPHLLVVGATGSGKSVLINALIYNILKGGPEKNQLVLIDPKRVELFPFKDCPHTLMYACESNEMMESLHSVVKIMEERYRTMQKKRIKKSDEFDIYVVIDEYADLMDVCKKPAENTIIRLAQLGRAAGIHIIAATQNCTTKVINTRIKSNFPARVCLKTATIHDSINVIGTRGAEVLPKHGKGYYLSGNDCNIVDIKLIPEDKINKLVDSYDGQSNPYKKRMDEIDVDEKLLESIIRKLSSIRLTSVKSIRSEYGLSSEEAERYAQELIDRGYLMRSATSDRLSVVYKEDEEDTIEEFVEESDELIEEPEEEATTFDSVEEESSDETEAFSEEESDPDERVEQIYSLVESQRILVFKLKNLISSYFDDHSISFKAFKLGWYELGIEYNETTDALQKLENECDEFLSPEEAGEIRSFFEECNAFVLDVNENIMQASSLKRLKRWL